MAVVKFTLSEDGVAALRDALNCLGRFSDELSLEAKRDKLCLTAINSSRSGYVSISFAANRFFSHYQLGNAAHYMERFFCKVHNKALLSLFRPRTGDPSNERNKDTTIDRCDVSIVDEQGRRSRFHVNILFRNGITTKYRLPFEISPPVHARFNEEQATNHWSISSRTLRQLVDHFGPGIDFLDIHSDDDSLVNFTCFTEKVVNGDEILKKPLHTSIAVERDEFDEFSVPDDELHIVISVKDFRAVVFHASPFGGNVTARYSTPSQPLQLRYEGDAIKAEFLLMTIGERGTIAQKGKRARGGGAAAGAAGSNRRPPPQAAQLESRAASRAPSAHPPPPQQPQPSSRPPNNPMIPSLRPQLTAPNRPSQQRPPPATLQEESLFVPQDNDNQWDPVPLGDGGDEDEDHDAARLEWDHHHHHSHHHDAQLHSGNNGGFAGGGGSGFANRSLRSMADSGGGSGSGSGSGSNVRETAPGGGGGRGEDDEDAEDDGQQGFLEPTQHLSDVRRFGLFGE